jgi:hypothetical protein
MVHSITETTIEKEKKAIIKSSTPIRNSSSLDAFKNIPNIPPFNSKMPRNAYKSKTTQRSSQEFYDVKEDSFEKILSFENPNVKDKYLKIIANKNLITTDLTNLTSEFSNLSSNSNSMANSKMAVKQLNNISNMTSDFSDSIAYTNSGVNSNVNFSDSNVENLTNDSSFAIHSNKSRVESSKSIGLGKVKKVIDNVAGFLQSFFLEEEDETEIPPNTVPRTNTFDYGRFS